MKVEVTEPKEEQSDEKIAHSGDAENDSGADDAADDNDVDEEVPLTERSEATDKPVLKWKRKDTDREDLIRPKDERMVPFVNAHGRLAEQWRLLKYDIILSIIRD